MFERLSDAVARIHTSARAEALAMRHREVGDDHLLLALGMGNDRAAELVAQRVSIAALHAHVAAAHEQDASPDADLGLSKTAMAVWERALGHAARLGAEQIDTPAMLLGLLDVKGAAVQALRALDVDVAALRQTAEAVAEDQPEEQPEEQPAWVEAEGLMEPGIPVREEGQMRPWPSPRCQGCRRLISDHVQLRTLDVPDQTTGRIERFRFLYCGACGTAFAIERIEG